MGLMTTAWWPHNQNLPPPGAHTPAIVALSLVQLYCLNIEIFDNRLASSSAALNIYIIAFTRSYELTAILVADIFAFF